MKSFLMLGQSNMAGRGELGTVPPIENPHCFMLRNGRWQPMGEPVNPDRNWSIHEGVSLAASFADEFAKAYHEDVGLIPCADGGTSIREWQPGELLYDHAVFEAKLAMRTSSFAGILWHQGENDSYTEKDAALYHDRFLTLFSSLFRDLSLPERTPVLIGELGAFVAEHDGGRCRYFTRVNDALYRLSGELPCAAFVSAEGLTCKPDHAHFDAPACRTFGVRYFREYQKLVGRYF